MVLSRNKRRVRITQRNLQMRYLSEANLQAAIEIETASYPEDEAASPENIGFRRANAGAFFLEATFKKSVSDRKRSNFPQMNTRYSVKFGTSWHPCLGLRYFAVSWIRPRAETTMLPRTPASRRVPYGQVPVKRQPPTTDSSPRAKAKTS